VRTRIANTLKSKSEDRDRELDDRPGAGAQRAWERKRLRAGTRGSEQERRARARAAEPRRLRYPLEAYDLPPLGHPVMTPVYGTVYYLTGEPSDHVGEDAFDELANCRRKDASF
jgi:hypothetical protein